MGSIYFISPVAYGMNPVFTAAATFIFQHQHQRFHITTRRHTCLTYLSTPIRSQMERGRNCNGTPLAGTHRFSRCGSHRRSSRHRPFGGTSHIAPPYTIPHIQRPVPGVLRSYRNTISRGNNLMAPERIRAACASFSLV